MRQNDKMNVCDTSGDHIPDVASKSSLCLIPLTLSVCSEVIIILNFVFISYLMKKCFYHICMYP